MGSLPGYVYGSRCTVLHHYLSNALLSLCVQQKKTQALSYMRFKKKKIINKKQGNSFKKDDPIFFPYWKYFYLPSIYGFLISLIPVTFLIMINAVIMTGTFWDYKFPFNNGCTTEDTDGYDSCLISIFDVFYQYDEQLEVTASEKQERRTGRTGLSLIVLGMSIVFLSAEIYIPSEEEQTADEEDPTQDINHNNQFDGNLWLKASWRRSQYILLNIFIIWTFILLVFKYLKSIIQFQICLLIVILVYFSFSNAYGEDIWIFLPVLKII